MVAPIPKMNSAIQVYLRIRFFVDIDSFNPMTLILFASWWLREPENPISGLQEFEDLRTYYLF